MDTPGGNYAFIDGANLHKGIQALGWKLDYIRFRVFLRDKYRVSTAYIFLGFIPALKESLYADLEKWGYVLIFKPTFRNADEEVKGNCDAELVLQAMIDLNDYERAVIVTGDGDFACLISYLKLMDKLEHVISPNYQRCSIFIKRLLPHKLLFLDRYREVLALK